MASLRSPLAFVAQLAITVALLLRVAVPAGWMPAPAGGFALTICSGAGPEMLVIGADGKPAKAPDGGASHKESPCAFSGLALPFAPSEPPALAVPAARPAPAPLLAAAMPAPGRGLAAPPPPATGPPARL